MLVDYLNELIALHEIEEVAFTSFRARLDGGDLEAEVGVSPLRGEAESTGVVQSAERQSNRAGVLRQLLRLRW